MAKLAILAVLMAALAAAAAAQGRGDFDAQRFRDAQCWREVQESPLDACRQVLERQLAGGLRSFPALGSMGLRMRCCQELQDVSRGCRCAAVRRMVRGYERAMLPLEEAYPGDAAGEAAPWQQQDPWFYGEPGYYGEAEWQQRQQQQQQAGGEYYGEQLVTRVKLTKVRQYGARLPAMCRIEPQECSVFPVAGGQY